MDDKNMQEKFEELEARVEKLEMLLRGRDILDVEQFIRNETFERHDDITDLNKKISELEDKFEYLEERISERELYY